MATIHSEAKGVLDNALKAIRDGNAKHGDTHDSFAMIGELWDIYLTHMKNIREKGVILPSDVAYMMVLLKVARAVYGSAPDNNVDVAGYSALAAALTGEEER